MKNIDKNNWKKTDINVDSLWVIPERDKSGKHSNVYHGNFIPQIPNQLIRRYTEENDLVLDIFMGSGTTLFECESLNRKFIGFDINREIISYVKTKMESSHASFVINECNVADEKKFDDFMEQSLSKMDEKEVDFFIAHPPYMDIIKFTELQQDLSQISSLSDFLEKCLTCIKNAYKYLKKGNYFAIVVGDIYRNSEVVPLAFYVMDSIKKSLNVKLKGTIVKNIAGNKGKLDSINIWRYRALKSDYYLFKHEYIFVFKKIK